MSRAPRGHKDRQAYPELPEKLAPRVTWGKMDYQGHPDRKERRALLDHKGHKVAKGTRDCLDRRVLRGTKEI